MQIDAVPLGELVEEVVSSLELQAQRRRIGPPGGGGPRTGRAKDGPPAAPAYPPETHGGMR